MALRHAGIYDMKKIKAVLTVAAIVSFVLFFKTGAQAAEQTKIPDWFDPSYYALNNPDVAASAGDDHDALYWHYLHFGKNEGRAPSAGYNVSGGGNAYIYLPTGVAYNGSPYYIMVDRAACLTYVFEVGEDGTYSHLIRTMICSVGREGHRTPTGNFKIYEHTAKGGWVYMADGTYAIWSMRFRTGGYMFHTVCFKNKGDAQPIPEEVAALGSPASLGCVRLTVEDAMWLYKTVPDGTMVTIGN